MIITEFDNQVSFIISFKFSYDVNFIKVSKFCIGLSTYLGL
jgi:hypothetical protein